MTLTLGEMKRWKAGILEAVQDAIGFGISRPQGQQLENALEAAESAFNGVPQALADAGLYISLPENTKQYTFEHLMQQAAAIVKAATDKAQAAVDTLASVGAKIGDQLAASMAIDKPSGVSDAQLLDRKQDLQQLLGLSAGSPESLQQAIINRIRKAVDQGDSLSAYVLSAGPLALWYEAQGLTDLQVQNAYSVAVGSRKNPDGSPVEGARLAALLRAGGSGAFQDYLTCCKHVVYQAQQDYESYLGQGLRTSASSRSVGDVIGR